MLSGWNITGLANAWGTKAQASTVLEAIPELVPEPTLTCPVTASNTPKRRSLLLPAPRQPSAKEHAQRLLEWIYANIDPSDGPITHAAIMEFYTEMLIEQDWTARPWNPVAHQFRLLTTGNRKTYAWITTTTGAVHRLRTYEIPLHAVDAASTPKTTSNQIDSRCAPKLRRAA